MATRGALGTPQITLSKIQGTTPEEIQKSIQNAIDDLQSSTQFWLRQAFEHLGTLFQVGTESAESEDTPEESLLLAQSSAAFPQARVLTGSPTVRVTDYGPGNIMRVDIRSGVLGSGTYSPTLTGVANINSVTTYAALWQRSGDTGKSIIVAGHVDITPALGATLTQLGMTLPISSNFANVADLAGVCVGQNAAGMCGVVYADTVNDRAQLEYITGAAVSLSFWYMYMYRYLG